MATSDAELVLKRKKRTQSKQYLNKAEKDLISCIECIENGEDFPSTRVDYLLEAFEKKLKLYDDRQSDYELLLNEDAMSEEIESASVYRDEKTSSYLDIQDKLLKFKTQNKDEITSNDGHSNTNVTQATLPKLELPLFKGDVCEWQSFWDKFSAIIDSRLDISNVNKFSYLQSLLRDEAKSCLQGLALTDSNYETAKELLRMRFGRKEKVVVTHIQKLLYISSRNNSNDLWKLYDEVQIHVRSLANLDIKGDNYGLVLTPLILHQLPTEIRMEWARQSEGKEGDLDHLLSFLYSEIQRRERSQTFEKGKLQSLDNVSCTNRREKRHPGTTSALLNVDTRKKSCVFCSGDHYADKCPDILPLDHVQRKEKIKMMNLCFRCLSRTHKADKCDKKCFHCKGNHHSVLHLNKISANNRGDSSLSTGGQTEKKLSVLLSCNDNAGNVTHSVANSNVLYSNQSVGHSTLMQCVKVPIRGHDIFVLFDSGSDRSYIKSETAKNLSLTPQGTESLSFHTFAAKQSQRDCPLFELSVGGLNIQLLGIENICQPMLRTKVPEKVLKNFREIPIYERLDKDSVVQVDILIGLDHYWSLVDGNVTPICEGLVAQNTKMGWMISGRYSCSNLNDKITHSLFCMQGPSETMVKQCWELDTIGIKEDLSEVGGSEVLDQFCKGVSLVESRYRVALPWKSDDHRDMLVNNVNLAQKRLVSLNKRLDSNPDLKTRYNEVFADLEQQNMIEEVPAVKADGINDSDHPIYYLPHRPVVRENSLSTKVRPVFDASMKGENGVSLNDCMNIGPNLIPDLTGILLRFRRWRYGLTADIQKAFLQIELQEADRDVHRFLLLSPDNQIRHMRFTRVTFGNASSPFILNATLKLHLSKQKENRTIKELRDNLYVDDWLTGSDDENNLAEMMTEADQVMKQGKFHLTKWASNSDKVRDSVGKAFFEDSDCIAQKVLGVGWDPHSDSFHFKFLSGTCGVLLSKRTLLGMIARIFDPLGFLNPFTITLKIMFQEAWKDGYEWDSILPEAMQQELECWISSLRVVSQWKIPRRLSCKDWSCLEKIELVVFADASERAYGSCVYLKSTVDDHVNVSLVISKVRVAPLKKVTLPRLELLAALLAARLLHFVKNSLHLPEHTSYVCYTDSMITLGWIQGQPFKWKQFVRNRVSEIQHLTDSTKWKHCPGKLNPADLLTRGVSASALTSSQWLKGPEWLLYSSYCLVDEHGPESNDFVTDCELKQDEASCVIVSNESILIDFDRFGSFDKLLRVVSYVLKFVRRLRKLKDVSDFDCLSEAKTVLFTLLQKKHYASDIEDLEKTGVVKKGSSLVNLCPFIGEYGLLRVKGRLGHAQGLSYDEKHPIILPKSYVSFLLVKSQHIALKHAGVKLLITSLRNKYWIISIRPLAKKVVRLCLGCQRHDSRLLEQCIAPLPEARLTQSPPFSVVGIDYAGPLYCSDVPGTKLYILLFTCAVTRAIHLELLDSMTADDFLLAFKRFVSRRAMPTIVYSDNAQTFKKAQTLLCEHLGHEMFKWQNQPALSPWWGGFYERMVRCVKSSLRKTIGKRSIPKKELDTVLVEIEACVNSRPLTRVSDNDTYLTPSHFLVGRGCPLSASELINVNQVIDLPALHEYHKSLLDEFWEIWRAEYLRALPPLRGKQASTRLKVGSIVLIQDENKKRMLWDLGLVMKVFKGLDGLVRAAKVKTKKNCIVRSVQRLVLLEVNQDDDFIAKRSLQALENLKPSESDKISDPDAIRALEPSKTRDSQNPISHHVTRSGRVIQRPKIFEPQ